MQSIKWMVLALRELGLRQLGLYALYRLGLRLRWYPVKPARSKDWQPPEGFSPLFPLPAKQNLRDILGPSAVETLTRAAERLVQGKATLFGSIEIDLHWEVKEPLRPWIDYELGYGNRVQSGSQMDEERGARQRDLRYLWEAARLGWVFTLGRAYHLHTDERYAEAFWRLVQAFLQANPPFLGPHWISAQEAALRIIAVTFGLHVFAPSPVMTPPRTRTLLQAIADHASRIPPTLLYARAQNNNHLLSEAAGLLTAGLLLPQHPHAASWVQKGWRWFVHGLQTQIDSSGVYVQQSTNYHRLMLQLALWVQCIASQAGLELPSLAAERLGAATRWLSNLLDTHSGSVPNLGPNDGAHILPLSMRPSEDFRPTVQAAGKAFLGESLLPPGEWDELSLWLLKGRYPVQRGKGARQSKPSSDTALNPLVLRSSKSDSWAYLRVARFRARPGHADQLHLDLWWRGENLAMDAGTYLYNAPPPWDNRLSSTRVHNTISVDELDQMRRVGKFLFLNWAQAQVVETRCDERGDLQAVVAEHDGYRHLGLLHRRRVSALPGGDWLVEDFVLPDSRRRKGREEAHTISLHWLLPDWRYALESSENYTLKLGSAHGEVSIELSCEPMEGGSLLSTPKLQLIHGGQVISAPGEAAPVLGWVSPTYAVKQPALSVRMVVQALPSVKIQTLWRLPE